VAESFDQVKTLGEPELRELLEQGRPEERVWAIWALALRSGEIGDLARREEPDPGVRRTLAVLLAGHGEIDLLVALARRDPAPEVRAAAMQLVARLALDGRLPTTLVTERALAEGAEVRIAILGVVFAGAPAWLLEIATALLEDRESEVRFEAFEALVRADVPEHALAWLEELPEGEARIVLMRWTARTPGGNEKPADRVRNCARVLAHASRRLRRLLVESVRVGTWYDLAPVIGDEPALLSAFLQRGHHALDEVPTASLLAVQLRESQDAYLFALRGRLAALQTPDAELAMLLPEYLERCEKRLGVLDAEIDQLRGSGEYNDEDLEQLERHREALEYIARVAGRLLIH
jgi:hypothetical protein